MLKFYQILKNFLNRRITRAYYCLPKINLKLILSINFIDLSLVKTRDLLLRLEIKIEVPQDIISDKKRLDSVQYGILKAISKGPYEEGLSFKIISAHFN